MLRKEHLSVGFLLRRWIAREALAYTTAQKALHWLVVALCAAQVPTSWAIGRTHHAHAAGGHPDPIDMLLHQVHAWTGWTILGIVAGRILLRLCRGVPPLPSGMPRWSAMVSGISHSALYAVLLALPVTGTMAMYVSGWFAPIHQLLTRVLLALVTIHVGAAVWHLVIRRDPVVQAMLLRRS